MAGNSITMTGTLAHSCFLLPDLCVCKPCTILRYTTYEAKVSPLVPKYIPLIFIVGKHHLYGLIIICPANLDNVRKRQKMHGHDVKVVFLQNT